MVKKLIVGALELGSLPDLGIRSLPMRVDTGAATSSLHVENMETFVKRGRKWVSFDLHPDVHNVGLAVRITAQVKGRKIVKSSTADTQHRIVIDTPLELNGQRWPIQLTLTDRSGMSYPMLLGREAMQGRLIVDPEHEFLLSAPADAN